VVVVSNMHLSRLIVLGLAISAMSFNLRAADPWQPVIGDGFGDANNKGIVELCNYKGQLFAGVSRKAGTGAAQIQRLSGINWHNGTPALPATAEEISSMMSTLLGPGYLYFATTDSGAGGPGLYRSADGASWQQINGPGSVGWVHTGNLQIGSVMKVFSVDT